MESEDSEIKKTEEDAEEDSESGSCWRIFAKTATAVVIGALSLAGRVGCYNNYGIRHPDPEFEREEVDEELRKYIYELDSKIENPVGEPLHDREEEFYRYIEFLEEVAGRDIDEENLDIIPSDVLKALGDTDPIIALTLPEDSGIYWHDKFIVSDKDFSLGMVAHEIGHGLDPELSSWDWVVDMKDRARIEATAHSFAHYVGLELLERGCWEGKKILPNRLAYKEKAIKDIDSMDELLEYEDIETGKGLATVLMNEHESMGKTWEYLATHDTEEVYEQVDVIIEDYGGFNKAMENGMELVEDEISQYTDIVLEKSLRKNR